jgi:hypothetical protein
MDFDDSQAQQWCSPDPAPAPQLSNSGGSDEVDTTAPVAADSSGAAIPQGAGVPGSIAACQADAAAVHDDNKSGPNNPADAKCGPTNPNGEDEAPDPVIGPNCGNTPEAEDPLKIPESSQALEAAIRGEGLKDDWIGNSILGGGAAGGFKSVAGLVGGGVLRGAATSVALHGAWEGMQGNPGPQPPVPPPAERSMPNGHEGIVDAQGRPCNVTGTGRVVCP